MKRRVREMLANSEKYLKTDVNYLARGGFWLGTGHVVAVLSGFILSVAFANLLPKEAFGMYKFVLSASGIIGVFTLTGLSTSVTRSIARGFEGDLIRGMKATYIWGIGKFLIGVGALVYYLLNQNSILAISILIATTLSIPLSSFSLYGSYLRGTKKFKKDTSYGIFLSTIPALSTIIALLNTSNVILIVTVYFVSITLASFVLNSLVRSRFEINTKTSEVLISDAKHLSLINALSLIWKHADKILIFHFLGSAELAIYAFAISPVMHLLGFNSVIKNLVFPKLAQGNIERIKEALPHKMKLLFGLSVLICGAYILFAPILFKVFYPQYLDSINLSRIFALSILFLPVLLMRQLFIAHMQKRALYAVNIISPIIGVIALLALLPVYGVLGAVLALLITQLFEALILFSFFKR